MKHYRKAFLTFFSEADMSHALVVVEVFDLEFMHRTTATTFVKKQRDDGSVSESFRRRDVWTVEESFRFLVT